MPRSGVPDCLQPEQSSRTPKKMTQMKRAPRAQRPYRNGLPSCGTSTNQRYLSCHTVPSARAACGRVPSRRTPTTLQLPGCQSPIAFIVWRQGGRQVGHRRAVADGVKNASLCFLFVGVLRRTHCDACARAADSVVWHLAPQCGLLYGYACTTGCPVSHIIESIPVYRSETVDSRSINGNPIFEKFSMCKSYRADGVGSTWSRISSVVASGRLVR